MNTPEDKKRIPEWQLFDRLDELEDITLKLMEKADITEPTLKGTSTAARDASILAKLGFLLAFRLQVAGASNPRKTKDKWIHALKVSGLSEEMLHSVDEWLVSICERIEKKEYD